MTYEQQISREHPTCFVFLIDQSTSMQEAVADGEGKTKAAAVADALNRLILELGYRAAGPDTIRDYYYIAAIGYGSDTKSAYGGALSDRELVSMSELAHAPLQVEQRTRKVPDGAGGTITETISFPVWVHPVSDGPTPMRDAFERAHGILLRWLERHPHGYPPIVINITDGEYFPAEQCPADPIERIAALASSDGQVLLLNLHISSHSGEQVLFPVSTVALADRFASELFSWSSVLPERIRREAAKEGFEVTEESRGFGYNADIVSLVQFLDIGTRTPLAPGDGPR